MIFYDFVRQITLPLKQIDQSMPREGKILDLGCGQGVISYYLSKQANRMVIGIDNNKKRLPKKKTQNLSFKQADIRNVSIKNVSGVVISDVLHHLSLSEQKILIKRIAGKLKKGGVLTIKEIDEGEFFRSRLSRIWDLILYPQDKINYWKYQDLDNFLTKLRFTVEISRPCRFFLGSTTLFVCKK